MSTAFTSNECDVLEQALGTAWDLFARNHAPDGRHEADIKAALTRAILAEYEHGEHNVRRIAIAAVAHIEQFQTEPDRAPKPAT